jgi:hypothetical protein
MNFSMAFCKSIRVSLWTLAAVAVSLAACSGPSRTASGPVDVPDETPVLDLSSTETFDVDPYRDEAPRSPVIVEHDVPEALMQSRADAGVVQVVDGFRVQVFSSLDRNEAVMAEEEVSEWWNGLSQRIRAEYGADSTLGIYNNYRQPLYRVRVGDFTRRVDAERLMALMASRFSTVFVVPDRVTIRR